MNRSYTNPKTLILSQLSFSYTNPSLTVHLQQPTR